MSDGYEEPKVPRCEGCIIRWGLVLASLAIFISAVGGLLLWLRSAK